MVAREQLPPASITLQFIIVQGISVKLRLGRMRNASTWTLHITRLCLAIRHHGDARIAGEIKLIARRPRYTTALARNHG